MKKVLALMLAMALVLGAALSGCGSSGEEVTSTTAAAAEENTQSTQTADNLTGMEAEFAEGQAHKGGKLTMGATDAGEFFSPYKQGTLVTYGWAVYEPLAWLSSDGTWTPCLAESWERDDENFTLTVHLRKDVTFSGRRAHDCRRCGLFSCLPDGVWNCFHHRQSHFCREG